jgi:hypothetical protein
MTLSQKRTNSAAKPKKTMMIARNATSAMAPLYAAVLPAHPPFAWFSRQP